jgi:hypothetical protein
VLCSITAQPKTLGEVLDEIVSELLNLRWRHVAPPEGLEPGDAVASEAP